MSPFLSPCSRIFGSSIRNFIHKNLDIVGQCDLKCYTCCKMARELFEGMRDGKTLSLVLFGEDDFIIIFGISSKLTEIVHLFSIHIMFLVCVGLPLLWLSTHPIVEWFCVIDESATPRP
jgi:hypothetical protein